MKITTHQPPATYTVEMTAVEYAEWMVCVVTLLEAVQPFTLTTEERRQLSRWQVASNLTKREGS